MKIDITKKLHQDNLKAEIYHRFKNRFSDDKMGIICEYKESWCRFDLIVYEKNSLDVVAIIEVRRINCKKEPNINGRQHIKYSWFGVKLFYISHFEKIDSLLDDLDKCFIELKQTA